MRVGNICFSDEFFSTTLPVREIRQNLEDELVRARPPPRALTRYSHCLPVRSATFVSSSRYVHPARLFELRVLTHYACVRSRPRRRLAEVSCTLYPLVPSRQYSHQPHCVSGKKTYSGKVGGRNDDLVCSNAAACAQFQTNRMFACTVHHPSVGDYGVSHIQELAV